VNAGDEPLEIWKVFGKGVNADRPFLEEMK